MALCPLNSTIECENCQFYVYGITSPTDKVCVFIGIAGALLGIHKSLAEATMRKGLRL